MIYTYLFTDKFFKDIRSNINHEQAFKVIEFFKDNFQRKENIFYCGTEAILDRNFGFNGPNSTILDNFISNFHSTDAFSTFSNKKNRIDFTFCGNDEKNQTDDSVITCEKILNKKNLEIIIENNTEDFWSNEKGKSDLSKKFAKVLQFSKSIIFVDRHVPALLADAVPIQIKSWEQSLKYFNLLLSNYKIKTYFINGINNRIIDKYKNKILKIRPQDMADTINKISDLKRKQKQAKENKQPFNDYVELIDCEKIIELKGKNRLKKDLINFFSLLEKINTNILVKDKETWRDFHERYIFCFFDNFDINNQSLKNSLDDKSLMILDVTEGLNVLDTKSKTTYNRIIHRKKSSLSKIISEKWDKKVLNAPLFYQFVAGRKAEKVS